MLPQKRLQEPAGGSRGPKHSHLGIPWVSGRGFLPKVPLGALELKRAHLAIRWVSGGLLDNKSEQIVRYASKKSVILKLYSSKTALLFDTSVDPEM